MKNIIIKSKTLIIVLIIIPIFLYSIRDILYSFTNNCTLKQGLSSWICYIYGYTNAMIIFYLLLFFSSILFKNFKVNKKALILFGIWSFISIFFYMEFCQIGLLEFGGPQGFREGQFSQFGCNDITQIVFTWLGEGVAFFVNYFLIIPGILLLLPYYGLSCLIVRLFEKGKKGKIILLIIIITLFVLSIIIDFYEESTYIPKGIITIEGAKNVACQYVMRSEVGCQLVDTKTVIFGETDKIPAIDANKDGKIDSSDTLQALCETYYGISEDDQSYCRRICGCS